MTDLAPRKGLSRRGFLGATLGGAAMAASPFSLLGTRAAAGQTVVGEGYGPLQPTADQTTGLPLLLLPAGFEYLSFGWTGDLMADGFTTPSLHDGMAAIRSARGNVMLVRNHERTGGAPFSAPGTIYDPIAGGGTTNLEFDPIAGEFTNDYGSLGGNIRNCAGGPHARRSWLSCEETTSGPNQATGGANFTRKHGYVFEVPADGVSNGQPIIGMGRFSHEATATDPTTGIVYETEDTGDSAIFRYVPNVRPNLQAGGRLEAMKIVSARNEANFNPANGAYDTRSGQLQGDEYAIEWVTIDTPDPNLEGGAPSCRAQAQAKGGAIIERGEGMWYGLDRIYFISTSGGEAGAGQVFEIDTAANVLRLVFESPGEQVLGNPDNVCTTPRGGIILCEDGGFSDATAGGDTRQRLHGLSTDGEIFPFAQNNILLPDGDPRAALYGGTDFRDREWAGACFEDRARRWLFVNIQTPGVTFAITGPWGQGIL